MDLLSIIPGAALGYATLRATTHPTSRIRRKMPNVSVKRLQVFPVIKFDIFGKNIHLHHWMNFSILLALSGITSVAVLDSIFTRGLLIGGIIHGLSLPRGYRNIYACKCSHCVN